MSPDIPYLATVSECARVLRLSRQSVRNMCADGRLPAVRVGREWRVDLFADIRPVSTSERGRDQYANPVAGRIR
jgi:excisionase family DNA binding protein